MHVACTYYLLPFIYYIIRVLITEYSDLNPVDHHKLNMKPDDTPTPSHRTPFIVGYGGSGTVEEISSTADDTTRSLLNQHVVFIADPSKDGSYSQYVVVDRRVVSVVPNSSNCGGGDTTPSKCIASHEAACVPIAGCTAIESLSKVGLPINDETHDNAIKEGTRLLIIGGAGGVGSWAIQLARAKYPSLEIVCTVGSNESADWCTKMGCTRTINHAEIEQQLGGGPKGSCDAIICLTEPTEQLFSSIAEVLRPYGKICLVVAGNGIKNLDMSFVFFKCGTVSCETVFSSIRDGFVLNQSEEMTILLSLMKNGRVVAPLNGNWDSKMSDWKEAIKPHGYIDLVGRGHMKGKLVMKIS